jgi:hypothetical protein
MIITLTPGRRRPERLGRRHVEQHQRVRGTGEGRRSDLRQPRVEEGQLKTGWGRSVRDFFSREIFDSKKLAKTEIFTRKKSSKESFQVEISFKISAENGDNLYEKIGSSWSKRRVWQFVFSPPLPTCRLHWGDAIQKSRHPRWSHQCKWFFIVTQFFFAAYLPLLSAFTNSPDRYLRTYSESSLLEAKKIFIQDFRD